MNDNKKQAIIIGAGPAGLTAAYELLTRTDIKPIIFEETNDVGGIAKTINYKGNRMDIGGHRFFSKSEKVVAWWLSFLPKDMLTRNRVSRIFFLRKFFDYPLKLNLSTLGNLGFVRVLKIGISYICARLFPIKNEKSLEDFFTNRFGKELYKTFFKDYTEKVWGVSCSEIKPEWGAQRIKGLSITKAVTHALGKFIPKKFKSRHVETSLIEQFMYPKLGPGQLWEEVARVIVEKGGEIHKNCKVVAFDNLSENISSVDVLENGVLKNLTGDYFFSTMPIRDLIAGFKNTVAEHVVSVASGLIYRDFITVGLLLHKLKINNISDNWIYIQEKDVKLGRIQVFNNWSSALVNDSTTIWIGLEYFCNVGDPLWSMTDAEFKQFTIAELAKIDIINAEDVLDGAVIRVPKAYPAYFGTYDNFDTVKNYLNQIDNLFLIGRNGMHRYNNMDHSMLTAMIAVDNIISGINNKDNLWQVNAEDEYQETKKVKN